MSKLFLFAINSLARKKIKNIATFFVIFITVFIISSTLFVATSLKKLFLSMIDKMPDITIQKVIGGRIELIEIDRIQKIKEIPGISEAKDRVWGYYFLNHQSIKNNGANFVLLGVDIYDKNRFQEAIDTNFEQIENGGMIVGEEAKKILNKAYFNEFLNFVTPKNKIIKVPIVGTFKSDYSFESSDFLVVPKNLAREILGIPYNKATDIVLTIPNPNEVDTIVSKLQLLYSDIRIITKKDLLAIYESIFDYKSGLFLVLFLVGIFVFFILIYEKASGLSELDKKEIGILKAVGWQISDVMTVKFLEHSLIALFGFIFGLSLAYIFVFLFNAPFLKEIFIGNSELIPPFRLDPNIDTLNIMGLAFVFLILYLVTILFPIWKSSTIDALEAMR